MVAREVPAAVRVGRDDHATVKGMALDQGHFAGGELEGGGHTHPRRLRGKANEASLNRVRAVHSREKTVNALARCQHRITITPREHTAQSVAIAAALRKQTVMWLFVKGRHWQKRGEICVHGGVREQAAYFVIEGIRDP